MNLVHWYIHCFEITKNAIILKHIHTGTIKELLLTPKIADIVSWLDAHHQYNAKH